MPISFSGSVMTLMFVLAAVFFIRYIKYRHTVRTGIQMYGVITSCERKRSFRSIYYDIHYSYNYGNASFQCNKPCKPGTIIEIYVDPAHTDKPVIKDQVTRQVKLTVCWLLTGVLYFLFFWSAVVLPTSFIDENEKTEKTLSAQMEAMPLPYGSGVADFTGSKYIAYFSLDQSTPAAAAEIADTAWNDLIGEPDSILWDADSLRYEKEEGYDTNEEDNPVLHIFFSEESEETLFTSFSESNSIERTQWQLDSRIVSSLTDNIYYSWEDRGSYTRCRICTAADLGDCRLVIEFTQEIHDLTEAEAEHMQTATLEMVRSIWENAKILDRDFEQLTAPGPWAKRKLEDVNGLSAWARGSGVWRKNSLENLAVAEGSVQQLAVVPQGDVRNQFSGLLNQKYVSGSGEGMDDLTVGDRTIQMVRRYGKKLYNEKKYRKSVEYIGILGIGDEAVICVVTQYGTYKIDEIFPIMRTIFSQENLEISLDEKEELVHTGTKSVPEGFETIGAESAKLNAPKYILAADESGTVSAAAEIATCDITGGEVYSVTWTVSSLIEHIRGISKNGLKSLSVHYLFSDSCVQNTLTRHRESTEKTLKTDKGEAHCIWSFFKGSQFADLNIDLPAGKENLWFRASLNLTFEEEDMRESFENEHLDSFIRSFVKTIKIYTSGYEQMTAAAPWASRKISCEYHSESAAVLVPGWSETWDENSCENIPFRDGYNVEMDIGTTIRFRNYFEYVIDTYQSDSAFFSVHKSEIHTVQTKNGPLEYILLSGTGGKSLNGRKYCYCVAYLPLSGNLELHITIKTLGVTTMENAEDLLQALGQETYIDSLSGGDKSV